MSYAEIKREPNKGGYQILPSEGSPFFISSALFLRFHLHLDEELDEETTQLLFLESKKERCYLQGLSYVARSEHTAFHLKQKLLKKGYESEIIDDTIDQLITEGSLSDLRYARLFIQRRQQKTPEGRARLQQRLAQKGVDRQAASKALDELFSEEQIITYIADAVARAQRIAKAKPLKEQLRAWGFSSYEIQRGLEELDEDELL